jgi:alkanesulfonate monooxygenase SsuD/methylene tetrahydromethanopterin reductase-like flavin-dependent oxidoreductase (luciferase family)
VPVSGQYAKATAEGGGLLPRFLWAFRPTGIRLSDHPFPPQGLANHRLAGEKGYISVSFSISPDTAVTAQHWDAVVDGAARSGRTPHRSEWRIIRDVYVAPTDAEARALAIGGSMGRCWREFFLPLYLGLGLGPLLKRDPSMPDETVDLDYVADNLWLVGSPETVAGRINDLYEQTGGFGYLVIASYDVCDEREPWIRNLRLLVDEVLPACPGLEDCRPTVVGEHE